MEVEVKYLLPENFIVENIFEDELVKNIFVPETDVIFNMRAFYFDTPDFDLMKNGLSFRIRYENNDLVLTTKYGGGAKEGLHEREEININVDPEFLNSPNIEIFKGYDVYEEFKKALNGKNLLKLLEMTYERKEVNIDDGEFDAVLSVDEGYIFTESGKERIFELEIENISGSIEKMTDFANKLASKYELIPCNDSKLKRGFEKMA